MGGAHKFGIDFHHNTLLKKRFCFYLLKWTSQVLGSSPGFLPSALVGRAKGIIHGLHTMYNTAAKEMIHPSTYSGEYPYFDSIHACIHTSEGIIIRGLAAVNPPTKPQKNKAANSGVLRETAPILGRLPQLTPQLVPTVRGSEISALASH